MLLGQSPARAAYDAQKERTLGARRLAAMDARDAAYKQAEEARKRNAILSGVLAASGSFSAGDYSRAALDAASATFPPLGRGVKVVKHLDSGDLAAAGVTALGGVRKMATPLALFDIGKKLVSGKPEEAALSAMRTVGVAAFGPLFMVGEGIFNLLKRQAGNAQYAPAPLDEETRALYERFDDADSAESEQKILSYGLGWRYQYDSDTNELDAVSEELIRAADALEDFALPGQFIGEGEPVPVNVLAAVSAMSDTGESGYTPVATRSPDGEIFYDERFLPVFEEVLDAIALGAAAAEMSGEYPVDGFLDGAWQLPVMSALSSVLVSPAGEWRRETAAEYYSGIHKDQTGNFVRGLYCEAGYSVPASKFAAGEYDPSEVVMHESGEGVSLLKCWYVPESKVWQYSTKVLSAPTGPSSPYTGPSSPGDPYIGPESAPSLYTGPSSPYTGPGSPDSPYTGPGSDSSGPYSVQPVPALPAKTEGFIVPGAVEPVKRPFPWWIVIATVILS